MRIKIKFSITIISLLLPLMLSAQRKQINIAQDQIKNGKDLAKAEKSMRQLLDDSVNHRNVKIWMTLFKAMQKQYEQGNEKLYLKQKYDTASLFDVTKRLFVDMECFDSICRIPDKKGRIDNKYSEKHAEYLDAIRPNLFYGGAFMVNKQRFQDAFDFYSLYLECAGKSMFQTYNYLEKDTMMPQVAYWASYCGYRLHNVAMTQQYKQLALRDTLHLSRAIQQLAEAALWEKDTVEYVELLEKGFGCFPKNPFFFSRLTDFWQGKERYDSAMSVVNRAYAADSTNMLFRYAKSSILLNTGHYDECIDICKKLIEEDDSLSDAYYNIGLAYFNQAIQLDKEEQKYRKKRRRIVELYELSLPFFERYRLLAPDEKRKWISPLYTIYLNLNKGKEFDEIDRIRHEYRRNHP